MDFGERIKRRREELGLTLKDVARELKVSEATVQRYESGGIQTPRRQRLGELARVLMVDVNYLAGYPGVKKPGWERPLTEAYQAAAQNIQQAVCAVLHIPHVNPGEPVPAQMKTMLVYSFPAAAGLPLYAEDDFEHIDFPAADVPRGADFGIRVKGDSMSPTISDGAIVWVHKQQELQNGQIGIFMLRDEAVCKRYQKERRAVRLVSDNPAYAPIVLRDPEGFRLVGRVLAYA